jgi:hypothetical protein
LVFSFATLKHLASNKHSKKLEEFWKKLGVFLVQNELKKKKSYYLVDPRDYRKVTKNKTEKSHSASSDALSTSTVLNCYQVVR